MRRAPAGAAVPSGPKNMVLGSPQNQEPEPGTRARMSSVSSSPSLQICRTCGGGAPIDVHFCPQCTKILSLGRHGDYFAFLGVPRQLNLDLNDLEQRFRMLSRQFHPDYFYNASPAERLASLERSSYLNDAYRTLKQPIPRITYLLELEGIWTSADKSGGNASKQV